MNTYKNNVCNSPSKYLILSILIGNIKILLNNVNKIIINAR